MLKSDEIRATQPLVAALVGHRSKQVRRNSVQGFHWL